MDFLFIFVPIKLLILNNTVMFTDKYMICFSPEGAIMHQLELDIDRLEKFFKAEEVDLIKDLAFYEEFYIAKTNDDSELMLDSFALPLYDFIKGSIKINEMEEDEFQDLLEEQPQLISKENIAERMELAKIILYKYFPPSKDKFF